MAQDPSQTNNNQTPPSSSLDKSNKKLENELKNGGRLNGLNELTEDLILQKKSVLDEDDIAANLDEIFQTEYGNQTQELMINGWNVVK